MKIPETTKFFVSNASDVIPNIQYVRNVDFDEEGYIKLSAPFPRLTSSEEIADHDTLHDIIPIGGEEAQDYKLATGTSIYDVDLQTLAVTLDASAPGGTDEGRFVGWKGGDWYYNATSDIYSLQATAGTAWDIENTDSVSYIEVFVNRNTLVGVGAGQPSVLQFTEADMDGGTPTGNNSGTTLAIPSNFEIRGLAYSNYRIGIATRSTTGGSAYFFVWDGTTTSASVGIPVFAPMIIDVVAYKNSWVVLTSLGQVLYFNGGGFDVLGNLPCYYFSANWVNQGVLAHGRMMQTDGDVIYFNIGTLLNSSRDDSGILQGFYSGVWCYDPTVGLYHRHALSYSKLYRASTSATSGVFTSVAHGLLTGDKVLSSTAVVYYAIYVTDDTFKLADTYDLAVLGTSSADYATNSYTVAWVKRLDWGQLTANNTNFGACIKFDNATNLADDETFPFFAHLQVYDTANVSRKLTSVMAPRFNNIGVIVYQKKRASAVTQMWQSVLVKYRPLKDDDKIIVKAKIEELYKYISIGEAGDITPDSADQRIAWTSSTVFTTTKNLTGVKVGHEVEVLSGAGAGISAHITSISESSGTWTVTLDETIRGASSGLYATCIIDSFEKIGVITKDSPSGQYYSNLPIGRKSKSCQIKLELRGVDVTIEETELFNEQQDRR